MSDIPLTITLELGELDKKSGEYPLRLLFPEKKAAKELARASIPQAKLDRTKLVTDPITKFLEEADPSDSFQEIGEYLYSLLHQGDIALKWDDLVAANERLRMQLEIKPEELRAFPWELVSDGLDKLSINPTYTLVRKYQPAKPVEKLASDAWPIRVLIVVGSKDDDEAVQPWPEIRRIETELHKKDRQEASNRLVHRVIDIQLLRRPSLEQLETEYKKFKPHVFHFIGHGASAGKKAYLLINWLNTDTGKYEPIKWMSDHIYVNFQGWGALPRFVLINACRSDAGTAAEDIQNQAWTIGDVFRRLGVPAVLTMQADINGAVAGTFAGTLYKSLAELDPLDTALAHARRAIVNFPGLSLKNREWAIPVLTIAIPPEDILRFKPKAPDSRLLEIKDCTLFKEIDFFSDRIDERRALLRGLYPLPPQIPNKDLIIVKGKEDAGKSWLVRWCMEACSLLNHDIRYVEVGGEVTKTWLDVLLQIRDGDDSKNNSLLIHRPLNPAAFHRFNWELEYRFKGQAPPSLWDGTIVPARKINMADPNAKWTPEFAADTFNSFQQALIQAAEINNPLIIVLDHFTKNKGITEPEMTGFLIPKLIERAAQLKFREAISAKESRSVKFIVVVSDTEFRDFRMGELISSYYEVPLALFNPANAADIMSEYLRYKRPNWPEEKQQETIKALQNWVEEEPEWTAKKLVDLLGPP